MLSRLSVLGLVFVLSACATGSISRTSMLGGAGPRHMVKVVTANSELRTQVEQALAATPNLSPVSEDAFSTFSLVLNDGLPATRAEALGSKPRIVGVLKSEKRPAYYRMGYTLVDMRGKPVTEGDVVGVGENQRAMFPALRDAGSASPVALSDALQQLATELSQAVTKHAWYSTVLQQAGGQVVIAGSEAQGLKKGMTFEVLDLPGSALKVVDFNDNNQTILEVTSGATPAVGYIVTRAN